MPVLWAVSGSVVQRRTPARQLGIPATGSGDDRHAEPAARLGYARPATQLGRGTRDALTFELDQSVEAGQHDATSRAAISEDMG